MIREAICGACGESFVPADDDDLDHAQCADGLHCGGRGTLVATYAQREAAGTSVVIWPAVTLHVRDDSVIGAEIDWSSAMGDATDASTGAVVDGAAAVALGEAVDRWLTDARRGAVLGALVDAAPAVLAPFPSAGRCVAVPAAGQWCGASLVLVERGHEREWWLEIDGAAVTAHDESSWSIDGDGDYFARCTRCGAEYAPPDEWEWD